MQFKNSFSYISNFIPFSINQIRRIYYNSSLYDKKISKVKNNSLTYKPTLNVLSCLIKYDKAKNKIEDLDLDSVWEKKNINKNNFAQLHNFYWLFTIDLKSSNKITQKVIKNWIEKYKSYNHKNWQVDILSKRIISWISNSKITYDSSENIYKELFDRNIKKQINHLINEINKSKTVDDKMLGCTAIIMTGLSYNDERYLDYGMNLLKSIINSSFDNDYFPKSRSIRQLVFYLKYFVLIRELLKDSMNEIPEYLNEIIFYLGKSYSLLLRNNQDLLFNGNHNSNLKEFNKYLSMQKYKFKNDGFETGGYALLENKNSILCIDIGSSPSKKLSENFQAGTLSFEFFYKGDKIICNSGYFQDFKNRLNLISKSTAAHSTLILDNKSSCKFKSMNKQKSYLVSNIKTFDKKINFEKNLWRVSCSHNGYAKEYGVLHNRALEFETNKLKINGVDTLIKKNNFRSTNFEIRFHLLPGAKLTKTQDGKTVLIELKNSGWKFFTNDGIINIESGLYFGNKNKFEENQNICISGVSQNEDQKINWELIKI